jgi:D-3-phosphoglycerate dehydrogenase
MPETQPKRPVVLLIGHMYHKNGEELLAQKADVDLLQDPTPDEILEALTSAHGACVRYGYKATAQALKQAANLLVISTSGRGTDAIDIATATEKGIAVVNNPGMGTIPVSEHAVGLMIDLAKQNSWLSGYTHKGQAWPQRQARPLVELNRRTLGIIGLGNIGSETARKCSAAFNMRVLAYDPYVQQEKAEAVGARLVDSLDTLLEESDFISIHAELTPETRHMINETTLRKMRPDAYLINTARGPIVDEAALARALRENWIQGAAIDVFAEEPFRAENPLAGLDNVILTPHVAGLTVEAIADLALSAATQILQVLKGERPPHLVNPEAWMRVQERVKRAGLAIR